MDHLHLVFLSSGDAQGGALGELLGLRVGGTVAFVDNQRKPSAQPEPDVQRVRPDRLEELYCSMAAAPHACTVVVSARAAPAMLEFLARYAGTVDDFGTIICVATPDAASQKKVRDTLTRLSRMGVAPDKPAVLFTQVPRSVPVEEAFAQLVAVASAQFSGINLEAVLHESQAFEQARELQVPITDVLRGKVNYQTQLARARQAGESEHVLHGLARKLLAQKGLAGCREQIEKALDALRVPDTSAHEQLDSPQASQTLPSHHGPASDGEVVCDKATRSEIGQAPC